MRRSELLLIGATVVFLTLIILPGEYISEAAIPPTRAFMRVFSGSENITSNSYAGNMTFTAGSGMTITPIFANNTIRFSASGGPGSLAMEGLTNVTDIGCAAGQVRQVNASGWYVCASVGTGDVTGAANVGTGTGTIFRDEVAGTLNIKTLKNDTGIMLTNNADDVTVKTGFKIDKLPTLAVDRFIAAFDNYTGDWTSKIFSINTQSAANDFQITGIDNSTGIITRNQFSVNNSTCVGQFVQQINNVTGQVVCASAPSGSSGFTSIVNRPATTAKILASNSSNKAEFKSLTQGQGITLTNGTSAVTMATDFKIDNVSLATDRFLAAFTNSSGDWTTKQFSVNTASTSCSGSDKVSSISINNATGDVTITCSAVTASGGATSLGANLTTTSTAAWTTIFTIPLTANSGNTVEGVLSASTSTAGAAVQIGARLSALNNAEGWCNYVTPLTATTQELDNFVLTTTTHDTGTATWLPAANVPQGLPFRCAVNVGASAPNLIVEFQAEAASTVKIAAGSRYLKTP